jgi:hypothetical protein
LGITPVAARKRLERARTRVRLHLEAVRADAARQPRRVRPRTTHIT